MSLEEQLALFRDDPLGFVYWAFPWGEPGELAKFEGPDEWQITLLAAVRDGLLNLDEAVQLATASGHGVGKSALVAWLILWGMSTMVDTRGVVTANTENQLKTKTWVELAKWFRMFLAREFFELTATKLCSRDPEHVDTWRIDMVPWSERNTEAFAGLHNEGRRILVIFDEASAIPDNIWETTEGALTDANTQIIWAVFGNPTRNTGRFRECFERFRHIWKLFRVDSRTVRITNKKQIAKWVDSYGEDSDFVRVRVKGVFPRTGAMEFIPYDLVTEARAREAQVHRHDPLIIGVDVARFGDDASVIVIRKGRDARTHAPIFLRGVDTMALAGRVAEEFLRLRADALFVDETGVGGGVVDRLLQLRVPVVGVNFGAKSDNTFMMQDTGIRYANKRAEIWGSMREWLRGGAIPDDEDMQQELVGPQYGFNAQNEIQLEKKEDMRKRGLASPDWADALALTFAYPVAASEFAGREGIHKPLIEIEYDPFSAERMAG